MRVVIAPNSFKHCLPAREVGEAMARGVRAACPAALTDIIPLSDGGDGLVAAMSARLPGKLIATETRDPLGRPIQAVWFKTPDYALIEMALASGLARLQGPEEYAPLNASTYGTGLLIRAAMDHGCRRIIIGLGGSATVDAGCGMASALGFRLLDRQGQPIPEGGDGLAGLDHVAIDGADSRLKAITAIALTDVNNPLLGEFGAARVFAPQKGASPADVETLERNLSRWATVVERDLALSVAALPGAGAAGGLGAGCIAFLGATLVPGAQWVAEQTGLVDAIRKADLVLTGEGRIDRQTAFGKVPAYVARIAKSLNKPAIAMGGTVADDADLTSLGITRCVAITPPGVSLAEAIKKVETNLEKSATELMMSFRR
ncbi:MAG: glycerate kinase [Verrucomicrobia bacterium]|nr:glycerate kinase [Verrucomicrobiota bacterium]MBU4248670.1 glycerate kinase [Verrucomicrobiota bacterium]MBU4289695.1 glycerate kinase [Verrucomicrobiota bacterium]MBU4496426.1 glycerate kinase [Verrucomicrobiota bacterium]MCG2678810.1 glycerate kinase [Kiritimatiellia bacterium]